MSNVPLRLRNISALEHYTQAVGVRQMVMRVVAGSAVPKSLRFTFAVPMAQTARDLVMHVVTANAWYPNTERNVEERKRNLTLAIADCEMLYQDLQCLVGLQTSVRPSTFDRLNEAIDRETALLRGARKGVRLIQKG